jgi:hypothetical protein
MAPAGVPMAGTAAAVAGTAAALVDNDSLRPRMEADEQKDH